MKKVTLFVVLALMLLVGMNVSAQSATGEYIIIGGSALPNNLNAQVNRAGGEVTGILPQIGVAFARSNNPNFANNISGVHSVIPDYTFTTPEMPTELVQQVIADTSTDATNGNGKGKGKNNSAEEPTTAPAVGNGIGDDETFFGDLWGMQAINAPEAWAAGSRGAGATVFVLDEGFDLDHPDLVFNTSLAESFVCYDIVGEDEDGPIVETNWDNCEPTDYMLPDVFSHGTHTSGTIGAEDNGMGVIGVAPDAEMVPVKVLSENLGYGFSSWIMRGIVYAADNGADVINMSLGGSTFQGAGPDSADVAAWRVAYNRAVAYAYQNNVTVVVSAGNSGLNADFQPSLLINPAMTSHAITISATGPVGIFNNPDANLDEPAFYTNIGNSLVDFAAPGGNVDFSIYPNGPWFYDLVLSTGNGGWYWSAGTSMAAPHAAGVAALIVAENGGEAHPAHVEQVMRENAEDLGAPGGDAIYGYGRVTTGY